MGETSQGLKKRQEDHYWNNFGRVRFISHLSGNFFQHLKLPERFVHYWRKKLPETVVLRGPGGFRWNVGLRSCKDGTLLFKYGWEEFVIDHSLEMNDELLFEYNTEESCFDVKIFVSSSEWCEKEASYLIKLCEQRQTDGKMKEKQPAENDTHVTPLKNFSSIPDTECSLPSSDNATSGDSNADPLYMDDDDDEEAVSSTAFHENGVEQADNNEQGHPHSSNPGQRTLRSSSRRRLVSHRRLGAGEQSNPTLRRAYAAKSPTGLVVSMQSRRVQNQHRVPIPRQWFVNCISKRTSRKVILRVKNEERTWVVPVYFRESEAGGTVELMRSGWKPFAVDNRIKEFDACLFEPAHTNHHGIPIIDVIIERQNPTTPILPPTTDSDTGREMRFRAIDPENNIALRQAREEEVPGISKVLVIGRSHVGRPFRVRLRLEWVSEHLSEQSKGARKVLLSVDKQMHHQVLLYFNERYKYADLTAGWKEFACNHSLNVFDVCLFNPAGTRNNDGISIINVKIFRNGPEGQNP